MSELKTIEEVKQLVVNGQEISWFYVNLLEPGFLEKHNYSQLDGRAGYGPTPPDLIGVELRQAVENLVSVYAKQKTSPEVPYIMYKDALLEIAKLYE